jgi:Flp pilus assembly protein CpaB
MNRRRGILWLVAGLVLAICAAGLSYFAFQQVITQQVSPAEAKSTQLVVVAKQLINERAVIRLADVSTEEQSANDIPSGAIFKTEDAIGRIADRTMLPGDILLAQNLVESFPSTSLESTEIATGTVNFNQALGEDLVAVALPATDRLSMEGILLPGDRVDLLFSTDVVGQQEGTGGKVSVYAIQDLEVLQIIYQPPPKSDEAETEPELPPQLPKTILLAIDPQDAVVLKYAIDTETSIDLALRAEDNRRDFEVDAVTINTLSERYEFFAPRPVR